MGHLRIGRLPKTRKWRDVVSAVGGASDDDKVWYGELANKTLEASNLNLKKLPDNEVLQRCFQFLTTRVTLATIASVLCTRGF